MNIQESIEKIKSADFIFSITTEKLPRLPRKLKKWLKGSAYGKIAVRHKRPRTNTNLLIKIITKGKVHLQKVRRSKKYNICECKQDNCYECICNGTACSNYYYHYFKDE